jgi:hypothetical protein
MVFASRQFLEARHSIEGTSEYRRIEAWVGGVQVENTTKL